MTTCAKRLRVPAISLLLAACVLLPAGVGVKASDPHFAIYDKDHPNVFWFLHASDVHVGMSGTNDSTRLQWLVTTAKTVINPSFIVVTGDLTDSTNGNFFGIPNGPYQSEWNQYKSIVDGAGAGAGFYYDLPGNHDAYSDRYFSYYLANSVQGRATGRTQASWTRTFDNKKYHFLGVNTSANDGKAFSLSFPYGDNAGLDTDELAFINQELTANADARLTMVFGHHPVTDTGVSSDTWLFYGHEAFIDALGDRRVSAYSYGHTHRNSQALFKGNSYTGLMTGDGTHYLNVSSLAKDSPNSYTLVAVDCDGVSSVTKTWNTWPIVLITAPVDRNIGGAVNPYAYTVPASSSNFVRALAFDTGASAPKVEFRIDGGVTWYTMSPVAGGSSIYQGAWDASALVSGNYTIEVRAVGTTTVSDSITVEVTGGVSHPPVANPDAYSVVGGQTLTVAAPGVLGNDSDAAGQGTLTAQIVAQPAKGTLTLNANGSFTYTPQAGFSGNDTFTYKAYDGVSFSAVATVTIAVTPAPAKDTVTVLTATWTRSTRTLLVEATSSAQPNVTLTVKNYGATMTWYGSVAKYTRTNTSKPSSVTVTSSGGGSATRSVTTK